MQTRFLKYIALFGSALLIGCGSSSSSDQPKVSTQIQVINNTPYDIAAVEIVDPTTGSIIYSTDLECSSRNPNCFIEYNGIQVDTPVDFIFFDKSKATVAGYVYTDKINNKQIDLELGSFTTGLFIVKELKRNNPALAFETQNILDHKILKALNPFVKGKNTDLTVTNVVSNAFFATKNEYPAHSRFVEKIGALIKNNETISVSPGVSSLVYPNALAQSSSGKSSCSSGVTTLLEIFNQGIKFLDSVVPGGKQIGVVLDNIQKNACGSSGSNSDGIAMLSEQIQQMNTAMQNMNGSLGKLTEA